MCSPIAYRSTPLEGKSSFERRCTLLVVTWLCEDLRWDFLSAEVKLGTSCELRRNPPIYVSIYNSVLFKVLAFISSSSYELCPLRRRVCDLCTGSTGSTGYEFGLIPFSRVVLFLGGLCQGRLVCKCPFFMLKFSQMKKLRDKSWTSGALQLCMLNLKME